MRVAISAFACDPTRGSERGVGWAWAVAAAERHDVVLFTGAWNRELIEPRRGTTGIRDVIYVDVPRQRGSVLGKAKGLGHYYVYSAWQAEVARVIERESAAQPFDLLHHLTYGAVWLPTYLHRIGVPVVLGPLGGAERVPLGLMGTLGARGVARECIRVLTQSCFGLWSPVRRGISSARVCLAKTAESEAYLRRHGARDTVVASELSAPSPAGVVTKQRDAAGARRGGPRFACVGRLQEFKGQRLALEAFALLQKRLPDAILEFYGDGPDRGFLEHRVGSLGLGDSVRFFGQVGREEVLLAMQQADALLHPTLHDSSGNVLVEAMACGLPVICLRIGGPAAIVPDGAGLLIQAQGRKASISGLADAMARLAENAVLRSELSEGGRSHAAAVFGEDAFLERIDRLYVRAVSSRPRV